MTVTNEALRMFLAVTALILTAMLASPADDLNVGKKRTVAMERPVKMKYAMRSRPTKRM
jgi:hypothetical protein